MDCCSKNKRKSGLYGGKFGSVRKPWKHFLVVVEAVLSKQMFSVSSIRFTENCAVSVKNFFFSWIIKIFAKYFLYGTLRCHCIETEQITFPELFERCFCLMDSEVKNDVGLQVRRQYFPSQKSSGCILLLGWTLLLLMLFFLLFFLLLLLFVRFLVGCWSLFCFYKCKRKRK